MSYGETSLQDDEDIVRDGERVTASMMTMDSVQRAVANSDLTTTIDADRASRAKLYENAEARLTSAWKEPRPIAPVIADVSPTIPANVMPSMHSEDRAAPYAAYNARIERQWETPLP